MSLFQHDDTYYPTTVERFKSVHEVYDVEAGGAIILSFLLHDPPQVQDMLHRVSPLPKAVLIHQSCV